MTKNDAVERAIKLMSRPIHEACEFIDETEVMPINRIERENLVKFLQALQTSRPDAGKCKTVCNFCPECGHAEYREAHWNKERECIRCGQSWFADVDYSGCIAHHLGNRAALKSGDKGRDAADEDRKWVLELMAETIFRAPKNTRDHFDLMKAEKIIREALGENIKNEFCGLNIVADPSVPDGMILVKDHRGKTLLSYALDSAPPTSEGV